MKKIIIGTRGSELALWQANHTKKLLQEIGYEAELKIISTQGDRSQQWNTSWDKLEGKGFFTKELEDALLTQQIDLAVHSHKDLPTEPVEGLTIAGVSDREDPCEVLLIRRESFDASQKFQLKKNAVVGTSSARRKSQWLAFRPDCTLKDLRGNVPTRIKKLRDGEYDAILLASAGLIRLGLDVSDLHEEKISVAEIVPAPAQGALAWQIRENDSEMKNAIQKINNEEVEYLISLERRVMNLMEGGCQLPLGVHCEQDVNEEDKPLWRFRVSSAAAWNHQPVQLLFETHQPFDFSEKIVEHIRRISPKKVFVSKNVRENDYLPRALRSLNFPFHAQSLIEFKSIPFQSIPKTDWIFFSSKQAVNFFFHQNPVLNHAKIACIGKATAQAVRQFGKKADFIGQSTDTKLVGKQFSALVGKSKVLFPMAKESLLSVQNQLVSREQAINLPVYATLKHPVEIDPKTEILVFTSPSNVDAFFEKNKFPSSAFAVAMGEATEKSLQRRGVKKISKTASFDDLGLFQAILSGI